MLQDWSTLRVTDGIAADQRLLPALHPGFICLEERGLPELLALAGELAGFVRFVTLENTQSGTWRKLFDTEPAVTMVEIMSFRLDTEAARFAVLMEENRRHAQEAVIALASRIRTWRRALRRTGSADFAADILHHLDGTADLNRRLLSLSQAKPAQLNDMLREAVDTSTSDPVATARAALLTLANGHAELLNVVASLKPVATRAFEARITSGDIDPALGLLIAELRLYGGAASSMNRLTERLTRFYYADVVGQSPRPAAREYRLLHIAAGAASRQIRPGDPFVATPASGPDRVFRAQSSARIGPARVDAMASIRFVRDGRISPQSAFAAITEIQASMRDVAPGARGRRVFDPDPLAPFDIGMDVASPMLFLAEGERRVAVTLALKRRSDLAPVLRAGTAQSKAKAKDGNLTSAYFGAQGLDPDIEQTLRADPALVEAFGFESLVQGIDEIGGWVDRSARHYGIAPNLRLLYHALAYEARTRRAIQAVCGRIMLAVIVEGEAWPGNAYQGIWKGQSDEMPAGELAAARKADAGFEEVLKARISQLLDAETASEMLNIMFHLSEADAFQVLLGAAFRLSLTSALGRLELESFSVEGNGPNRPPGLTFRFLLDDTVPAIVAPDGQQAPVLSIRQAQRARITPVSFFDFFALESVRIDVEVKGLTDLSGFSDGGAVATGAMFYPFGARPRDGAKLVLGSPELACKPVSRVALEVEWVGLPDIAGGFAAHYSGYGEDVPIPRPMLDVAYLSGDAWKQLTEDPLPMARTLHDGSLVPAFAAEFTVPGGVPAPGGGTPDDFRQRLRIRAGVVQLTLRGAHGFLSGAYPEALAKALRPSLLPWKKKQVPPAPVSPQIGFVAMGYHAKSVISIKTPDAARPGERLTQVGPFGAIGIFPGRTRTDPGLFPKRLADGLLCLRLAGAQPEREISLLFEMAESAHRRTGFQPAAIAWHYMTVQGWRALPEASIASDTTGGLMRSGVVTLTLPADAVAETPELPGQGHWIAAASDRQLDDYPQLASVRTNGVWVQAEPLPPPPPPRVDPAPDGALDVPVSVDRDTPDPVAAGPLRDWRPLEANRGLGLITEVGTPRAVEEEEDTAAFKARVSEHLHHRGRAVTAWDVERLVLEEFPEVWKVKCLPAFDRHDPEGTAGRCAVLVVPRPPEAVLNAPDWAPAPLLFDVLTLRQIARMLTDRGAVSAQYTVANPSYERLQMRAQVCFRDEDDDGAMAMRLNRDMQRHVSVWTAQPPLNGFGWSVSTQALRAVVMSRPYVRGVAEFSVLQHVAGQRIRAAGERYQRSDGPDVYNLLNDSAVLGGDDDRSEVLRAVEPWSLPLSAVTHRFVPIPAPRSGRARPAGIGTLGIGDNLVVPG